MRRGGKWDGALVRWLFRWNDGGSLGWRRWAILMGLRRHNDNTTGMTQNLSRRCHVGRWGDRIGDSRSGGGTDHLHIAAYHHVVVMVLLLIQRWSGRPRLQNSRVKRRKSSRRRWSAWRRRWRRDHDNGPPTARSREGIWKTYTLWNDASWRGGGNSTGGLQCDEARHRRWTCRHNSGQGNWRLGGNGVGRYYRLLLLLL